MIWDTSGASFGSNTYAINIGELDFFLFGIATDPGLFTTIVLDGDGDGVLDSIDNCPSVPNADQLDSNGDTEEEEIKLSNQPGCLSFIGLSGSAPSQTFGGCGIAENGQRMSSVIHFDDTSTASTPWSIEGFSMIWDTSAANFGKDALPTGCRHP